MTHEERCSIVGVCENLALTFEQTEKVLAAIDNGDIHPDFTDDIFVNHAVDCYGNGEIFEMDVQLYKAEITAAREAGMLP